VTVWGRASRLVIMVTLGLAGCHDKPDQASRAGTAIPAVEPAGRTVIRQEPIEPLPESVAVDSALAALGEKLFHDARLSADATISCATCHDIAAGGEDGRARSLGIGGKEGEINAPTVLNSGLGFAQFWDGRAETLEDQVDGPLLHRGELGSTWEGVIARIGSDPAYREGFARMFPDGLTASNIKTAIAAFERTLVTPDARFDRWLRGDSGALTATELKGYELFKEAGCITCHQGRNVGGNMFQRFGVMGDYFRDRGGVSKIDWGRFNVTGDEADRFVFKVPGLRNIEHTAPYFHDGSAKTLPDAVRTMARYQLGQQLSDAETESVVAFLKTLSGKLPERYRDKAGSQ